MNDHQIASSARRPPAEPAGHDARVAQELAARCGFSLARWRQIEARAHLLATDPFDLAIADGVIRERDFVAALATMLEVPFSALPPPPVQGTPADEAFAFRSYSGMTEAGQRLRVIAPNGLLAGILLRRHQDGKRPMIILTTRQALLDQLVLAESDEIAHRAAHALPEPFSARIPPGVPGADAAPSSARSKALSGFAGLATLTMLIVIAWVFPMQALVLPPLVLAPVFIIAGLAVLTATFESGTPSPATPPVETAHLPHYSILVPLYREANIASQLVRNLSALIYPRDRLEAFLLVEADDAETRAALDATELEPWMLVMTVPPGQPRTKPRALNAALPLCHGGLVVVYDAEDAPEPDQLLRAAALFRASAPEVACVQARLAISNVHDGFLTRRFAIDYAALFDCVKAGMGRAQWPMPLGGSSNHFRTEVLRQVGGWDAWNVTEDADLGLRLARFGWLVADLRSTTWEEAPNTLRPWMNQRTRWLKGWMQTLAVHARRPQQLAREFGTFRMMITGSMGIAVLLGALLYPVFAVAVLFRLFSPTPLGSGSALLTIGDSMLVLALVVAVLAEGIPAIAALRRRKALALLPYVVLAPVTHLLISLAAWRALYELHHRPFHWHKTDHGLAKTPDRFAPIDEAHVRSTGPRPPK
ncbi:MAG: hypothetical protein FD175_2169 [Beijerinckiaceae bacterium]|nr:MAG: hypothetical protein FD175_2169 [Beijerinckiaceae bacterium]